MRRGVERREGEEGLERREGEERFWTMENEITESSGLVEISQIKCGRS